ncbi:MAG: V-type ATP synthase subunit I [Spirochaetaceae bacterium]|jgi:V/A-type H+-transporting ATPase subunit I|nr:V-type ATP synthase subunit I [Spirochaetaceae bacterium]
MIVPMKKVSLVVMDKAREVSLERLRDLGVMHLEKKNVQSEALTKVLERRNRIEAALGTLRPYRAPKGKSPGAALPPGGGDTPEDLAARVLALADEKKSLQEQLAFQAKERSRVEKWGDFDPKALGELAEKGVVLIPYELSLKDYESLPGDCRLIVLGKDKTLAWVLAVGKEIPGANPWTPPERSLSGIDALITTMGERLADIEDQFRRLALRADLLEGEGKVLRELIEFETAKAGMEPAGGLPGALTVSWFSGFVPADELGVLKRAAAENGWALLAGDPGEDDQVPTKLKNNKFASLINPLTDFLEVVPGYHEVDISGWFLFFFCVFFGMIFGDAGYGALLVLGSLAGIVKTSKKGVPPALKLFLLLGFSNFVWGVLTCSWFGIGDVNALPPVLRNISLPLISNVTAAQSPRDKGIVQQNLMIFCFSLALLQLSIGHILAIIKGRTLKALADLGSIAMVAGMYCIVLSLIASNEYRRIPLLMPAVYVFAGGFFLNFLFANYEGSFGRSVLESLKNIISVILGIANVFSDIMSYIRLWAVGLAGAAIASTVNAMAGPMLGHFILFIFGVVLLVFGHGLNIVLNVLSVLVHGVRLNTLEFSGHVGLTWSGYAYRPFAKRIKKETRSG